MKRNSLSLLFLSAMLAACSQGDVNPDYLGKYNFTYTIKTTKNGVPGDSDEGVKSFEVTKGSGKKTVRINNLTDNKGNIIDFKVDSGAYEFTEEYESQGCKCKDTMEGKFESGASMTYRQELIADCGKDKTTVILEGKGVK